MLSRVLFFMEVSINSGIVGIIILLSIFVFIGVVLLLLGINEKNSKSKKKEAYSLIEGRVSGYTLHSNYDSETYGLVVTYTVNGVPYQCKSKYSTNVMRKKYPLNTKVLVRYNQDNPLDSFLDADKGYSMLVEGGISFIVLGLIAIFFLIFLTLL